jgi:hypothetical protein
VRSTYLRINIFLLTLSLGFLCGCSARTVLKEEEIPGEWHLLIGSYCRNSSVKSDSLNLVPGGSMIQTLEFKSGKREQYQGRWSYRGYNQISLQNRRDFTGQREDSSDLGLEVFDMDPNPPTIYLHPDSDCMYLKDGPVKGR